MNSGSMTTWNVVTRVWHKLSRYIAATCRSSNGKQGAQDNPVPLDELIRHLHREGWLGWTHLRMAQQLRVYLCQHPEILKASSTFFNLTTKAHVEEAMLHVARLFDKDGTNVEYLLNRAVQDSKLFRHATKREVVEACNRDRSTLAKLRQFAAPAIQIRHKKLAHYDKKHWTDPSALSGLFQVKLDDLEAVLNGLSEIVNRYNGYLNGSEELWEIIGWEDFERLAVLGERGLEARRQR